MFNIRVTYLITSVFRTKYVIIDNKNLGSDFGSYKIPTSINIEAIPLKSKLILFVLLFALMCSLQSHAQDWGREKDRLILKDWGLNLSGGTSSYYGDLSTHDNMFFGKMQFESGPAYSVSIIKEFGRSASIEGQLIKGNLVCKNENLSIETNLFEYNLQGKINIVELMSSQRVYRKFGLIAFAGVGNFLFTTEMKEANNETIVTTTHKTRVPEFIYFFGGGIKYDLSARLSVTSDISIRQCQNDMLDMVPRNGDFDYYSYLNIGITYHIHNLVGKSNSRGEKLLGWERMKPIYRPKLNY